MAPEANAGPPTAETRPPFAGRLSAELRGFFATDVHASWWFELGSSTAYGQMIGNFGTQPEPDGRAVTLRARDLEPDTTYHYRFVLRTGTMPGEYQTYYGDDVTFRTQPAALPEITNIEALPYPSLEGAWVSSGLWVNGLAGETWVEYGETHALGRSTRRELLDAAEREFSHYTRIEPLTPHRRYYFRVLLETALGRAASPVLNFATGSGAPPAEPVPPLPAEPPTLAAPNQPRYEARISPSRRRDVPAGYTFRGDTVRAAIRVANASAGDRRRYRVCVRKNRRFACVHRSASGRAWSAWRVPIRGRWVGYENGRRTQRVRFSWYVDGALVKTAAIPIYRRGVAASR